VSRQPDETQRSEQIHHECRLSIHASLAIVVWIAMLRWGKSCTGNPATEVQAVDVAQVTSLDQRVQERSVQPQEIQRENGRSAEFCEGDRREIPIVIGHESVDGCQVLTIIRGVSRVWLNRLIESGVCDLPS
jgi:hypothetical protein